MVQRLLIFLFLIHAHPLWAQKASQAPVELKIPENETENDLAGEIIIPVGDLCDKQIQAWDKAHKEKKLTLDCPTPDQLTDLSSLLSKLENDSDEKEYRQACQYVSLLNQHYSSLSNYVKDQDGKKWKIKIFMGNTKTWYDKTDVSVKTSRLDLKIDQAQPYERRSTEHLNWHNWVDEPTNTLSMSFQKNKDKFFVTMFHPKFVFVEGDQEFKGHHYNENVRVKGTADGHVVDGVQKLKGNFGPNRELLPGQVYFVSWENSHKLLQFEAGYGHEFNLVKVRGAPVVKFTPEVAVGVYTGIKNSSYSKKDNGWEWDQYDSDKTKIMGKSASAAGTLEVTDRRDRIGVFVQGKYSAGKMDYDFLDGKATHRLDYKSVTMGINFKVIGSKAKKMKPKGSLSNDSDDDSDIEK